MNPNSKVLQNEGGEKMDKKRLLMLIEIAIFAGIGIVLDKLSFSIWAQGGSISFVMLPIVLIAIRWGLLAGLTTGLLIGLLQTAFGAYILHPVQGFLDYFVAFTVVGLAGIVRKPILKNLSNKKIVVTYISLGIVLGGMLRYITHTIAGYVFFKESAGDTHPLLFSISYNGSYMVPAIILTAVAASLLFTAAPRLLKHT